MGMYSAPSAPEAPDPIETGRAQTATNVSTAIANQIGGMINQNTPYGSLTYDQTGTFNFTDPTTGSVYNLPRFTANQTLTPQGQTIQNNTLGAQTSMSAAAQSAAQRMQGLMGQGINTAGLPGRPSAPTLQSAPTGNYAARGNIANAGSITSSYDIADRGRVEEALMSRLNPQLQQDRASREAQLQQQGITLGSAAYDRAMAQLDQQSTDARMQAVLAGGQEQSRLTALNQGQAQFQNQAQAQQFGQNAAQTSMFNSAQGQNFGQALQGAAFNNQSRAQQYQMQSGARDSALQEQVGLRNQQLNEIQALLGGSQVQSPNFVNTQGLNMPTTDYAGLIQQNYANQMAQYQQQMGQWNGLWGGLMGAGANIGMAALSDARAKTDILRIGTADNGLPLYTYRYKSGGPVHAGVMAQDVLKVNPSAVVDMGNGMMGVNYAEAFA